MLSNWLWLLNQPLLTVCELKQRFPINSMAHSPFSFWVALSHPWSAYKEREKPHSFGFLHTQPGAVHKLHHLDGWIGKMFKYQVRWAVFVMRTSSGNKSFTKVSFWVKGQKFLKDTRKFKTFATLRLNY